MIIKPQKNVNPLLLKFGVALAISFAGFLFSRIRTKRIRPALPPPPPSSSPRRASSDSHKLVNSEDGSGKGDTHCSPRDPNGRDANSSSSEVYEQPYLRIRVDKSSTSSSPNHHSGGDRDSLLLPEFNNLVTDFSTTSTTCDLTVSILNRIDGKTPKVDSPKLHENHEREGYLKEIHSLRNRVRSLKEKERYLELQLLKYHNLKEQVNAVTELQSRLKIHNVESKLLALRIDSLEAENGRLRGQTDEYSKLVYELDNAKLKIKDLKKKLRSEAERNREQILSLKQRVAGIQLQEQQQDVVELKLIDPDVELKLQKFEDLENEMEDLKKSNCELQFENSELARKLDNAEIYASAVLNNPKIEELNREAERLKEENINLSREIERLHSVRCADVEELVYLRWLNACLRYELRNYEPPAGKKVARDLSRSLSPTSEREAKRLILEYANTEEHVDQSASILTDLDYDNWFSSNSSDEVSVDHQSLKPQKPKKKNVFTKLMKLVRGKQFHSHSDTRSSTMESTSTEELDNRYSNDLPHHSLAAEIGNAAERIDHTSPLKRSLTEEMPRSESFVIEDVKDLSRLWTTPSRTSTPSSLELNRPLTSLSEVDAPEVEMENRSISPLSSSYIYRRRDFGGRGSAFTSPRGSQTDDRLSDLVSRKSDLAKYAEVLKDSSPWVAQKGHRKAASLA